MPAHAPVKFTLYNLETYEPLEDYICNFIPVRYLKLAIRLAKSKVNINPDTLAGLIVDLFKNEFSVNELRKHSEESDRMQVLQEIMTRAGSFMSKTSEKDPAGGVENAAAEEDENWLEDLEITLVKSFGWSLQEIDATDMESLFPFVSRFAGTASKVPEKKLAYIDQVDWI